MWITWMTSARDGHEHAVDDDETAAAGWQRSGVYPTICGRLALPRSLTSPPGPRCPRCIDAINAECPAPVGLGFRRSAFTAAGRALRSTLRQILARKE